MKTVWKLGDILAEKGSVTETFENWIKKGWSQTIGLLSEVPSGPHRMKLGLKLREVLLCRSMLLNSEAWSDVREAQIDKLEVVDRALLRSLVEAHSKTPKEFLFLEAEVLKFIDMIKIRRMIYHQEILQTDKEETIDKFT